MHQSFLQKPGQIADFRLGPIIFALFCISFCLRLAVAVELPSIHRPDEVFQTLEPAFHMVSGGGILTWEWHDGIRSPLFPAFIATFLALGRRMGLSATGDIALVHAVFAVVSASLVSIASLIGWKKAGWGGAILCGVLSAVWPDLVYFGPKTLSEVQGGNLLMLALYIGVYAGPPSASSRIPGRSDLIRIGICGLLLGLAFVVRFPLFGGLGVIALFACGLDWRRRWPTLILSALLPVIVSGAVDRVYWGSWFQSIWLNYYLNITHHVSDEFGVQSRLFFVNELIRAWGSATILILFFALVGCLRAPALGLVALAIIISHSLIAHKEISFIYAAIPPIVVLSGLGTSEVISRIWASASGLPNWSIAGGASFWILVSLTTALSGGFRPRWTDSAVALRAAKIIAADEKACGLALESAVVPWFRSGGTVFLGKDLPIYPFATAAARERALRAANYVIGAEDPPFTELGYRALGCWPGGTQPVCLYRATAERACVADPDLSLQATAGLGRVAVERNLGR